MILRDLHHTFKIKIMCDKLISFIGTYNIFWESQKVQRYAHRYVSSLELVNTDTKKKRNIQKMYYMVSYTYKAF